MTLIAADEVAEHKGGARGDSPRAKAIEGRTPLQLAWARLTKDKVVDRLPHRDRAAHPGRRLRHR